MGRIEVFSPAKINVFLAVTGRQPSGFHELASLVLPLDFGDTLAIEAELASAPSVTMTCDDASLPTDAGNLAYRAAERFLERFGIARAVRIDLHKRVPHGAGLGGGSSNAAATLRGLAELCEVRDPVALRELAAELGSDCPLFLAGEPVIMRGRGERLEGLEPELRARLTGTRFVLLKPSFAISTPWAYRTLAARSNGYVSAEWAEERLAAWRSGAIGLSQLLFNSFESVAFEKFPSLAEMRDAMADDLGVPFLMSGSGSCCVALANGDDSEARCIDLGRELWGEHVFAARATAL